MHGPAGHLQPPLGNGQLNDRNVIRRQVYAIPRFLDPHRGVGAQKIRQDALVLGAKMLDQDEGHAAVRRHVVEEGRKGLETAGRGPDRDDQPRRPTRCSVRLHRAP
jgi:hypothetical protein